MTPIQIGTFLNGNVLAGQENVGKALGLGIVVMFFGSIRALDGLNLEIEPGELVALLGVMRDGRLEQVAAPGELYAHPATAFVAEFVGTMNRIPGELEGDGRVHVLGSTLPTKEDQPEGSGEASGSEGTGEASGSEGASGSGRASRSGPVDVLVRPEDLRLTATSDGSGIVTIATFLGSLTRVSVLLSEDVTVQVDVPSTEAPAPGAPVEVKMTDAPVLVTERR